MAESKQRKYAQPSRARDLVDFLYDCAAGKRKATAKEIQDAGKELANFLLGLDPAEEISWH